MERKPPSLSIVLPAYNEADSLESTIDSIWEFATTPPIPRFAKIDEIVIVNDGSSDGTLAMAQSIAERFPIRVQVTNLERNLGKGGAVRAGMSVASCDFHMFMDADGEIPITNLKQFGSFFLTDPTAAAVAVAVGGPSVFQGIYRQALSTGARLIISQACNTGVRDTQRGFKLFTRQASNQLFDALETEGWLFDVEILRRASLAGMPIRQVEVAWEHIENRASSVHRAALPDALRELWRIRQSSNGPTEIATGLKLKP